VQKPGRPTGATSWWRNLDNVAAHYANALLELWLAGTQVLEIRVLLFSLASSPENQATIEGCWKGRGNEWRHTVPTKIKLKLCRMAVAHVMELRLDANLRQRAHEAKRKLRIKGWTDTQIAEILGRAPAEHNVRDFKAPDVKKVLELVNRRAPEVTLRRKKAQRRILRK
jgi:hypothetical protein